MIPLFLSFGSRVLNRDDCELQLFLYRGKSSFFTFLKFPPFWLTASEMFLSD